MLAPPSSGARGRSPARELTLTPASPYSRSRQQAMDLSVGDKVEVARAGGEPSPATVTELTPLGSFPTWQAERAIGDHDRNTLRLRLDPEGDPTGFEPGTTVWLKRFVIFSHLWKPMEVPVKLRLLLTSALFLLAQMPTMQAQETLDLAK